MSKNMKFWSARKTSKNEIFVKIHKIIFNGKIENWVEPFPNYCGQPFTFMPKERPDFILHTVYIEISEPIPTVQFLTIGPFIFIPKTLQFSVF